jgi:hypothetical protein
VATPDLEKKKQEADLFRAEIVQRMNEGVRPVEIDKFGFPVTFSLFDDAEKTAARLEAVEALAKDIVEAVVHQVGYERARRLFKAALQKPKKGRQQDKNENASLLAAYDAEIKAGTPEQRAARAAAEKMTIGDDPESVAKQIRKLKNERAHRKAEHEALMAYLGPTLLHRATKGDDPDL